MPASIFFCVRQEKKRKIGKNKIIFPSPHEIENNILKFIFIDHSCMQNFFYRYGFLFNTDNVGGAQKKQYTEINKLCDDLLKFVNVLLIQDI